MNPDWLAKAFGAQKKFPTREGEMELGRVSAGDLVLPTGKICCSDPFTRGSAAPFALAVKPGTYAVELATLATPTSPILVATARIVLSNREAKSFAPALIDGEEPGDLRGYGVDAGNAAFLDEKAATALETGADTILAALSAALQESTTHAAAIADEKTGANIVAFASGTGDGVYAAWWGFDDRGEPASLVTDFLFLDFVADPLVPGGPPATLDDFLSWLDAQSGDDASLLEDLESIWLKRLLNLPGPDRKEAARVIREAIHSKKQKSRRDQFLSRLKL